MANERETRILIVEDEFLVAMLLEDLLLEMGYSAVTCIARLDKALQFVGKAPINIAILDVNLDGDRSYPVAEILRRRGIPFIFATGYGVDGVIGEFRNERVLQKPYDPEELKQAIDEALARVTD